MKDKLTLRMDKELIKAAKEYSLIRGTSISKLVSEIFTVILKENKSKDFQITPAVASLKGILKNKNISENDYKKYLENKFL